MDKDDDFLAILIIVTLLAGLALGNQGPSTTPIADGRAWAKQHQYTCQVDGILSGDEVVCNGGGVVHLIGVDAPARGEGEMGTKSRQALERLVPDSTRLRIELDTLATDTLGRVPAYLYLPSGHLLNEVIVWNGYGVARPHPQNRKREPQLLTASQDGHSKQRGLWKEPSFRCFATGNPSTSDCPPHTSSSSKGAGKSP